MNYSYTEFAKTDPLEGKFALQPIGQPQDAFMMYPLYISARIPGTACYLVDKMMVRRAAAVVEGREDDFFEVDSSTYEITDLLSAVVSIATDMGPMALFDTIEELVSYVMRFGWR